MEQLHQQVMQKQIPPWTQLGSVAAEPAYKRPKLEQQQQPKQLQEEQQCGQVQHHQASGTAGKARPLLAGQWYKAYQRPVDWQLRQQQLHEQQVVQMGQQDVQQLPHAQTEQPMQPLPLQQQEQQQQQQQQYCHIAVPEQYCHIAVPDWPAGEQMCCGMSLADGGFAAAGLDMTAPDAQYDDPIPERGAGKAQMQQWQQEQQGNVNKARSTWACLACTYSSNKAILLRCEVCDTPKGDSSAPPASWLRTKSSRPSNSSTVKAGSHSKHQGNKSHKTGAKQMRLDSVVQTRARKARGH